MKISFIGSGRMAEAIIRGLIASKAFKKSEIFISDKDAARTEALKKKFKVNVCKSNVEAVSAADIVVLSVKPQVMALVLTEISKTVRSSHLYISIAAGITLKSLEKYLLKAPVVRVMPNNPCLIGEGVSLISGGKSAKDSDILTVEKLFSSVGQVFRVEERLMNAVTALSGSGPAFVYEFLDALINAGAEAGLPKELSAKLAQMTVLGSIKTVLKTKKTPEELKNMVASPGGTTIAGLRVMDEMNFKGIVQKAVLKAAQRAKEISEEFDKTL